MFADLLRAQRRLRRHVRSLTVFVQRPRDALAFRGLFIRNLGSLGAEMSPARSDPEDPSDPAASVPPFVCGAGALRAGIYDEGCFGCVGIWRVRRIAPG